MTRRPLRVCHLAYTFYENDNRVLRYAEWLAEHGHEVDVIALRRPGQAREARLNGVRVLRTQRRAVNERGALTYLFKILWFLLKASLRLTVLQLRRGYDLIHVHNVPDFLVFAAWLPKLMGARIILDIHDVLPELYSGKFGTAQDSAIFRALLLAEQMSCRFADHVIIANHLWFDKLIQRSVPADRCTTILNYPDLSRFSPLPSEEKRRDGRFIMLYPGTLNRHQGVDVAIRAFARCASAMPDAELHIYGEGPARAELEQLARETGLGGRIKIMDRVPLSEVARIIAAADVGVVPKRAEGFGNEAFSTKILEFMACEVPVLVSRTRIDAFYFDDTLVRFFESGHDGDLAAAMLWAYEHRAQHGPWIRNARDFAVRYSWQERSFDYHRIIASLVPPALRAGALAS
jgi:glycosyltransferase involved in cell wall biosynthesis